MTENFDWPVPVSADTYRRVRDYMAARFPEMTVEYDEESGIITQAWPTE